MKKSKKSKNNYPVHIKVVGVGGGGGNAVTRMSTDLVRGVELIAVNTDAQDLDNAVARKKLYIGKNLTKGLGTGMNPEIGRQSAEENRSEIVEALRGADLIFITAGLGGGTGTGAGPVVAEAARETGALTVGVVTKPFAFEGSQRNRIAQEGLSNLKDKVDALIVISNDKIFSLIQKDTPLLKAFEAIDEVLHNAVQGVADLIASPGLVNVDFADVRAVLQNSGTAIVGLGVAGGNERATNAVAQALSSPLLEVSVDGAKGVLFGIAANKDLRMTEVDEIAKSISESVDSGCKIIFGAYNDRKLKSGKIKVTLIAANFNGMHGGASGSNLFGLTSIGASSFRDPVINAPSIPAKKSEEGKLQEPPVVEEEQRPAKKQQKEKEDVWDIPTFLRKKKKK